AELLHDLRTRLPSTQAGAGVALVRVGDAEAADVVSIQDDKAHEQPQGERGEGEAARPGFLAGEIMPKSGREETERDGSGRGPIRLASLAEGHEEVEHEQGQRENEKEARLEVCTRTI